MQVAVNKNKTDVKKVLIVDDHELLRMAVSQLIEHEDDLVVCGEAEDAKSAMKAIEELKPDIAIVDITLKDSHGIELVKDIKVLSGGVYISEAVAAKMLSKLVGDQGNDFSFPIDSLSNREFEVFELIGQGLPSRKIAKQLHVSIKTIDAHREHIKKKLGLQNATDLLMYAVQWTQFETER